MEPELAPIRLGIRGLAASVYSNDEQQCVHERHRTNGAPPKRRRCKSGMGTHAVPCCQCHYRLHPTLIVNHNLTPNMCGESRQCVRLGTSGINKKYSAILVKLLKIEGFKVGESAVILAILANGERRL